MDNSLMFSSAVYESNWLKDNIKTSSIVQKRYNIGIDDKDYCISKITPQGKKLTCKAYTTWSSMLRRVNSEEIYPTYKNVEICKDWLTFSNFREWWIKNYVAGYQLDKDILTDNKIYSPETCIYVPSWLNSFITNSKKSRGDLPIGVDLHEGKYRARCRHPFQKGEGFIGNFKDPETAYNAWLTTKLKIAEDLKMEMDKIDKRIYPRIVVIIKGMK